MCGSLKLEGQARRIGDLVVVYSVDKGSLTAWKFSARWAGFIQREKLSWWKNQTNITPVLAAFDSFTEKRYTFKIPYGRIQGVLTGGPVILNGKVICPPESFKIITRAPLTQFEKKLHDRWPFVMNKEGQVVQWAVDNDRNGQMSFL